MDVKSNIRHRRQERLRQISAQSTPPISAPAPSPPVTPPSASQTPWLGGEKQQDEHLADVHGRHGWVGDADPADPEKTWKARQKMWYEQDKPGGNTDRPGRRRIGARWIICLGLFILIWGMFQLDAEWAKRGQSYVAAAFTDSFPYHEWAEWYGQVFGGVPSFIPAFQERGKPGPIEKANAGLRPAFRPPAKGMILASYSDQMAGIVLATDISAPVQAASTGRVIFAGQREDTGLTVIVQHADQYQTVYGMLAELSVAANDWLEAGESVGQASPNKSPGVPASGAASGMIYFSITRNLESINPADVVKFD